MGRYNRRRKGMRFLIFLLVLGLAMVKIGSSFNKGISAQTEKKDKIEAVATSNSNTYNTPNIEEKVQLESNPTIYYMEDESKLVDVTEYLSEEELMISEANMNINVNGEVLGWFDCKRFDNIDSLESAVTLCTAENTTGDFIVNESGVQSQDGDSVLVSTDSTVEFTKVTYPLVFFLGQYVLRNNLREISYDSPEYSSNGENIQEEYITKTLAPGDADRFRKDLREEAERTERKIFQVKAELSLTGDNAEEKGFTESKIGVKETEAIGECPFVTYNYNPEVTNYMAYHDKYGGYLRQQAPGGNNFKISESEECLLEGQDYFSSPENNMTACLDWGERIKATFRKVFDINTWNEECVPEGSSGCIDTANIGIKMTPVFGMPYDCNKDGDRLCANAFLTDVYRSSLSPTQAGAKRNVSADSDNALMYFIATPCDVKITSSSEKSSTMYTEVQCLWDASQTHLNYRLQAKDRAPGDKKFPNTFNTYWGGVLQAIGVSSDLYVIESE